MNKNILKWVLVAAVILGAAAYLILSETPSKKERIVVGHSKPFKIEPVESITISAPKNALDKDREFKLTPVDDKTYDKVVELLETEDLTPFMVFDLDAGMKPGEFLPGDYDVVIDLNKMGIPENLQEHICVYRVAKNGKKTGAYRYNTQLADGKLSFKSNQNSFVVTAFLNLYGGAFTRDLLKFMAKLVNTEFKSVIDYYYLDNTTCALHVSDTSGNFVLYFRFRDTENPDGYTEFAKRREKYQKQYAVLEKQAKKDFEDRVQKELEKEHIKPYFWEDWFPGKQVQAIKKKIGYRSIFQDLIDNDPVMKELKADPAAQLPKSIETIKNQIIRANRYLDSIGLHKLDKEIPFFLLTEPSVNPETYGAAASLWVDGYCVVLNYSKAKKDEASLDHTQVTLVHELFHVRQQNYYTYTKMGSAAAEATATVLERDAAKKWYKDLIITECDPTSTIAEGNLITDREDKEIFGYPFNIYFDTPKLQNIKETKNPLYLFSNQHQEYTYGAAIEGIREGVGKESVTMKPFMDSYSLHGPHISAKLGKSDECSTEGGWIGWIKYSLGIDGEQFNKGWRYFGEQYMPLILASQKSSGCSEEVATKNILLTPTYPIEKIDRLSKPQDYTVNTFHLEIGEGLPSDIAHIFVVCKPKNKKQKGDNPYVSFYMSDYQFKEYIIKAHLTNVKPTLYYEGNPANNYKKTIAGDVVENMDKKGKGYYLGVVTTAQSKGPLCDYYAVALFKPEAPEIRKVKDDKITFIVPKPARALTKEKLITGVVVTYKDKNGEEYTREIEPKNFGKKATWTIPDCSKKGNSFTLSLQWYYKPDEQTTYVSPIGEPAQWGAKGDQPEEEENVQTKEPETNYWKQVSSRMTMKNTSIDVDESNDDEVSSDYRSIDLQAAKTGRSLEFTGMGATEEKTKENGRVYVQDIFIEGTLTYTEPPKFWIPTQQYKAHWEIADDPYLTKVSDPFVFEAKNTSSDQAACAQSKKDKIDNGRSSVGKANWLRGAYTTFEARHPEKNGPKSFTLTQTYSIKERQGSDLMATVTFVYNYEWVGEEEPEPEVEEETVPEGGYWKMVKSFEDKSKAAGETHPGKTVITGGRGNYKLNWQYEGTKIVPGGKASQSAMISPPQKTYLPGEKINFDYSFGDLSIEGKANTLIAGVHGNDGGLELLRGICRDYKETNYGTFGFVNSIRVKKSSGSSQSYLTAPTQKEAESFSNGHQFSIVDKASAAGGIYCTIYVYEWVDGGKTAESVKDEPSQEDQGYFLDITEIQFYCHTNEPYGKGVVYTTYDHQGVSYKFKKTGSSSTFNGRDYDSEDVFTTTRSGDYQIVTAKFRQNKFDGSKANVDGYRSGGNKTCVDEEFTLTLKIAKDRSVEGTFSGTRKTLAGAGSWPEVASTCNMSISGSFGPEKIKDNDYSHDFTTINSFSYSVGGFQAYFKRADGTMPTNVDNTREFKFSTTSTNARICLSIFGTK